MDILVNRVCLSMEEALLTIRNTKRNQSISTRVESIMNADSWPTILTRLSNISKTLVCFVITKGEVCLDLVEASIILVEATSIDQECCNPIQQRPATWGSITMDNNTLALINIVFMPLHRFYSPPSISLSTRNLSTGNMYLPTSIASRKRLPLSKPKTKQKK